MLISVYRYDYKKSDNYEMQDYNIDPEDCDGVMLLDALNFIKSRLDDSLSYRRSCAKVFVVLMQ